LRRLELALDSDYEFFVSKGSSVSAAANHMLGIANAVSAIYEKEVAVVFSVGTLIVRDQINDPWNDTGGDPILSLLEQFKTYWNANQGSVQRDTAHIISGRGASGAAGAAWLNGICIPSASYAATAAEVSNQSWGTHWGSTVHIFAHEMGHNSGACHCAGVGAGACSVQSCSTCFLMTASGSCNPQLILGPVSAGQISAYLNTVSCLSSDGTASPAPTLTAISPTQVTVFQPANVTLTGTGLQTALNVKVGTTRHYISEFVSQTPTQIEFKPKQGTVLGNVPVTVHGPGGTSAAQTLEFVPTNPPKLSDVETVFPSETHTWNFGGLPGHAAHVLYSTDPTLIQIGTWSVLANAQVLQTTVLDGLGLGSFTLEITAPVTGPTFYIQVLTYQGSNLTGATNVDVVPVF
jgi:hypothetical protein